MVNGDLGNVPTNKVTITAQGSMGFAGTVNLSGALFDSNNAAIANVTPTFSTSTITLTTDGTGTADVTVNAPGDISDLNTTLKITATSSAAEADAQVAFMFNPVFDIVWTNPTGNQGVYEADHIGQTQAYSIKAGRQIAVYNGSTVQLTVHTNGDVTGFPHENAQTAPNQAYIKTLTTAGDGPGEFYWHNSDNETQSQHSFVKVVP
jgi:hypothetical protein